MDDSVPPPPQPKNTTAPAASDMMEITVKTIDSKNFQFQVEQDLQIKMFKERIAAQVEIEPEHQRMIFCGRVLSDDKTLKDYTIDNGKTIHLVKKAPLVPKNNNTPATTNNADQQNDRTRFQSYRSEDGSFVMGTISLENPSNLLNQMVRQIFNVNRTSDVSGSNASDSTNSTEQYAGQGSAVRSRINYVRRFIGYVNTNFQILENPNQMPTPAISGPESTEPIVTTAEYQALFAEAFAASERLRPHMTSYFQSLPQQSVANLQQTGPSNHSILMRITHHLSHIMHLLTEFNIDYSAPNMPLTLNILDNPISAATNLSVPISSLPGGTLNPGNVSARIEISSSQTSVPRFPGGGSSIFAQSPIVLMEVDTNINLSRNIPGLRNMGSFPFAPSSGAMSNAPPAQPNPAGQPAQTTPSTTTGNASNATSNSSSSTSNTTTTTSTSTCIHGHSAQTNTSVSASQGNATTNSSNGARTNGTRTVPEGEFPLAITFDPFLNCNSTYTIPEVRSAANLRGIGNVMQHVAHALDMDDSGLMVDNTNPLLDSLSGLLQQIENSASQESDDVEPTESAAPNAMQVETTAESDRHSISNDSEVEFSDAISDLPSTSTSAPVITQESQTPQNWENVVPNEWVPIINEDINKQKNIDTEHQPSFSDAYLNGMPKKRRLEHKPDDDENPDAKLRPKPQ